MLKRKFAALFSTLMVLVVLCAPRALAQEKPKIFIGPSSKTLGYSPLWVAWKKGNFQLAKDQCQAAIELWESDPAIRSMVMVLYWLAVWPMLGIHLADNQLALAISDCHCLLEPNQIYMPEELIRLLQQAVYAWEAHQADTTVSLVQKSLALAEQMLYL